MEDFILNIDFKEIYNAISNVYFLNRNTIEDIAAAFAKFSNQKIDPSIIEKFKFTGLSNEKFLTSDFLHLHQLKNLIDVIKEKQD